MSAHPEQDAFVNLQRIASSHLEEVVRLVKPYGLSAPQYNVLRILRGAQPNLLPCGSLGERMITREPDITRLLDRLETRGLVTRSRGTQDRRVVKVGITEMGLDLLAKLDQPVLELHGKQFEELGPKRTIQLQKLLERLLASQNGLSASNNR